MLRKGKIKHYKIDLDYVGLKPGSIKSPIKISIGFLIHGFLSPDAQ